VTGVSLVDAFENGPADVKSYKVICAPAAVDGSGVQDNVTHLMGYKLKKLDNQASEGPRAQLG